MRIGLDAMGGDYAPREIVRGAVKGPEGWNEWHWFGNRADGSTLDVWGVTILTCASDRIQSGRFYLEEHGSGGVHATSKRDALTQRIASNPARSLS